MATQKAVQDEGEPESDEDSSQEGGIGESEDFVDDGEDSADKLDPVVLFLLAFTVFSLLETF